MTEEKLMENIASEYREYMDKINSLSKTELFENAQWISSLQICYEQMKNMALEPDDVSMLSSFRKPLAQVTRAYMRVYAPEAFALLIGGGIIVVNDESKRPLPDVPSINAGFQGKDGSTWAAFMRRLESEYVAYGETVIQQSREQILSNAETIAMRQAVYGAIKEYPFQKDEFAVVSSLHHPLKMIGEAVDKEDSTDDLTKADIFDFSLASLLQGDGKEQKKKNRHTDAR